MSTMTTSKSRSGKNLLLSTFIAISFVLGTLLGAVLASIWIEGAPLLQLSPEEAYTRSITIVGIDKTTGEGRLAVLKVELRNGSGHLSISVPPYENEDTQRAAVNAKKAAEILTNKDLSQVDITITVENISPETLITGPSSSAAMAVLMVAAIRASENSGPNAVRQDVVVSASVSSTGVLEPVGEIIKKYQTVREAGEYSLFVIAATQLEHLHDYPGISVERARNLDQLAKLVLEQ
ncbi:MAG: hypothetical protein DRN83_03680 [Hadesarchaea archaeon]|nr:MAG: hypothetical protein DRN83_03680 [Hadesarchaea archaeon]